MSPAHFYRVLTLLWLACWTFASPITPARAGVLEPARTRDIWQTVQARKLLLDDPQLAPLNLGVKVVEGAATLWGPVPSAEFAHRAELRLRNMIELEEVRNQLIVIDEDVPPPLVKPAMPQFLPDRLPPALPPEPRLPTGPGRLVGPGVELVGDLQPIEPVTVQASPAATLDVPTLRLPLLGTINLPRSASIFRPVR